MDFRAKSDENRLIQNTLNWTAINAYTSRWVADTWFDISITRKTAKTSDPQRKYYFSTVIPIYADDCGYDQTEYYEFHVGLKYRFFRAYYKGRGEPEKMPYMDENGVLRKIPKLFADDSDFDVKFKAMFINSVIKRAAEKGVYIPNANE